MRARLPDQAAIWRADRQLWRETVWPGVHQTFVAALERFGHDGATAALVSPERNATVTTYRDGPTRGDGTARRGTVPSGWSGSDRPWWTASVIATGFGTPVPHLARHHCDDVALTPAQRCQLVDRDFGRPAQTVTRWRPAAVLVARIAHAPECTQAARRSAGRRMTALRLPPELLGPCLKQLACTPLHQ
jgi:hypothetical protein